MKQVFIPQNDANSTGAIIREWVVPDHSPVVKDQVVAHVETSKAIYDVFSPCDGTLIHEARVGCEMPFTTAIAAVMEAGEAAKSHTKESREAIDPATVKATKKALALAKEKGIDLSTVKKDGIISEEDVKELITAKTGTKKGPRFLKANEKPSGVKRVLAIGAGNGLAQISDILMHSPEYAIVGCVDDATELAKNEPFGIPLIGKTKDIKSLFKEKVFDCAIVAITSQIEVRRELFNATKAVGVPFINAIDPSARINRFSSLGTGNVICSFVHIGTYTSIGDNNFISAHCSIDHHNLWGSHITLGPGCHFSGRVAVEDSVKFATGIFVQNKIEIGEGSIVASGAMITGSIPKHSMVKTQISYTIKPIESKSGK